MDSQGGPEVCLNLNKHRQRLFDVLVGIVDESQHHLLQQPISQSEYSDVLTSQLQCYRPMTATHLGQFCHMA